jgi:O-methyltransferase involved in polyketide biosynthesis
LCGIAQVRLSEAQETLLVTLCGRAWDARARQPILGGTMAEAAVEQMDYDFWRAKVNPRRRRSPPIGLP